MRKCKICNSPLLTRQKNYCSNKCKFSDPEYNNGRVPTIKNDPRKAVRHKETGKVYKDENNLSGVLSRYSEEVLGRDYNSDDWELIELEVHKTIQCQECGWKTKDIDNRNGMLSIHIKKKHPELMLQGYWEKYPEQKHLFKKQVSKVEKQIERDRVGIECKECGKMLKKITVSHLRTHGMTPKQYRDKYNVQNLSCDATREKLSKNYYDLNLMSGVNFKSKKELEVESFLSDLGITVISGYRKLGVELDMYLPDYSVAIEFDGLYWHSEKHGGKGANYHLDKTNLCEANGISLIHIFEDEWNYKSDIVKSRLLNKLGLITNRVYARNCIVREVSSNEKNNFLESNHIQGKDVSKVKLGLYYADELVSIMTFSSFRKSLGRSRVEGSYELSRFCSKIDTVVLGAASKLYSYFEKNYNPKYLITYADKRWTSKLDTTLYDSLGFTYLGDSRPSYWYMYRYVDRTHRYVYAKHKILDKFDSADPNLTEWDNMKNLGFDRIWDCGTMKYEKQYEH